MKVDMTLSSKRGQGKHQHQQTIPGRQERTPAAPEGPGNHERARNQNTLVFRSTHSKHESVGLFRFCFFLCGWPSVVGEAVSLPVSPSPDRMPRPPLLTTLLFPLLSLRAWPWRRTCFLSSELYRSP